MYDSYMEIDDTFYFKKHEYIPVKDRPYYKIKEIGETLLAYISITIHRPEPIPELISVFKGMIERGEIVFER